MPKILYLLINTGHPQESCARSITPAKCTKILDPLYTISKGFQIKKLFTACAQSKDCHRAKKTKTCNATSTKPHIFVYIYQDFSES